MKSFILEGFQISYTLILWILGQCITNGKKHAIDHNTSLSHH